MTLQREAAVGDDGGAGHVGGLVRGQIDGECAISSAVPSRPIGWRSMNICAPCPRRRPARRAPDPLLERGRVDGAGANAVAADALADEVHGDRLGEPDRRRPWWRRRRSGWARPCGADGRRDVDDRASCPWASMPGRNARIVRCIDLTLRSKEKSQSFSSTRAPCRVHEARRVEQHVDRAAAWPAPGWRRCRAHRARCTRRCPPPSGRQARLVQVAGDHPGALARERDRRWPGRCRHPTPCRTRASP